MINPYNPPDVEAIGDSTYLRLDGANSPTTGAITFGAQTIFDARPRFNEDLELAQGTAIRAQATPTGPYQAAFFVANGFIGFGISGFANNIGGKGFTFQNASPITPAANQIMRTANGLTLNSPLSLEGRTNNVLVYTANTTGLTIAPDRTLTVAAGTTTVVPMLFQTGTLATSPATGAMEFTENTLFFTPNVDRRSIVLANEPVTADVTVADTVVETDLYVVPIAANSVRVGKRISLWLAGIYSTANASDTATIRVYGGPTLLSTLVTVASNVTDEPWHLTCDIQVRSLGASGSIVFHTDFLSGDDSTHDGSTAPITVDTTATDDITVTVEWDSADPDNSFTLTMGDVTFTN